MSRRSICVLLFGCAFALSAYAVPGRPKHQPSSKIDHHDPAFRRGYDDGYRQGATDSAALSNAYKDEIGPAYDQATDGYTPQYGDQQAYQKLFRLGYVAGYKAGWDFNSGQFCSLGCGGGGP